MNKMNKSITTDENVFSKTSWFIDKTTLISMEIMHPMKRFDYNDKSFKF